MQPHSTETMTERTTGASPPLSQSVKRKREEENEEDAGSSSSKLCELWTADGGVCRDIWRTHVVKYLNRSDRKFFYSVNKGTRKAMKELHTGWYENYFKQPFTISDLSSISTLEVAWENYDFTKANARGHFIREAAATGDVQLLRWVRKEKGVDRRMQKIWNRQLKADILTWCSTAQEMVGILTNTILSVQLQSSDAWTSFDTCTKRGVFLCSRLIGSLRLKSLPKMVSWKF